MDRLIARTPETFREKQRIDARVLHEVKEIDLDRRRVSVRNLADGTDFEEPFDHLMVATGAIPFKLDVSNIDAGGIFTVGTLQSGIELRRTVDEDAPGRAVIIGGGYIGLEMAEAFLKRGLDVSLVEMLPQVMGTLDPDMGEIVSQALRDGGVHLYLEERLEGFEVENGRVSAVTTDKRTLPADIVIMGTGMRPNTDLAKNAGIPLGVRGAIKVNERMQTESEGVWAAGDCVEAFHLVSRRPTHIALATIANKQGRVAGANLGGEYATFPGVVGTAITKFQEIEVARTGLQEKEIDRLGWKAVSVRIDNPARAHYYPGTENMTVKLLAEKGSGRLLGGQIIGRNNAAKRIDIVATALHAGWTVDEMLNLDLAYAPPFSPTWDPVLIAIRQIIKRI